MDPAARMNETVDPGRLLSLLDLIEGRRVVIAGDLLADEFIYGEIARVSREAPVLILNYDSTEVLPGGAGNAAANVAALGGFASAAGLAGRDDPGRRLLVALKQRDVDIRSVIRPVRYRTPTKTRILAGGIHSAKQQVVRIDRAAAAPVDDRARAVFRTNVLKAVRGADALLVSDYGCGLATPQLVTEAQKILRRKAEIARARRRWSGAKRGVPLHMDTPVLVDSRYNLLHYHGMTACTPNESEVEHALGVRIADDPRALERAGRTMLRRTHAAAVLITRGSRGMALFEARRPTVHIPIFGSDQIADVTGAGDTVIAMMTLALSAGATFEEAARLANYAGGIVVMKRGTATVGASELRYAISGGAIGRPSEAGRTS
jgi:bifunctional ADP-heptose synthase (sugar kinase/adenylyltransferase)